MSSELRKIERQIVRNEQAKEKKQYAYKAHYRESENIQRFIDTFGMGVGMTRMVTISFRDNITDKKEASGYWNVLLTSLKKALNGKVFRFIAVWERQMRGCWHIHLLVSAPEVSNNKLKDYLNYFRSVSNLPMGWVKVKWTYGTLISKLKTYLTKYLLKENREPGVRYVGYSMNWIRKVKGQFAFLGGQARKWRLCCIMLDLLYPSVFRFFYENAPFDTILYTIQCLQKEHPIDFVNSNPMYDYFKKHDKQYLIQCEEDHNNLRHIFNMGNMKPAYWWQFITFSGVVKI